MEDKKIFRISLEQGPEDLTELILDTDEHNAFGQFREQHKEVVDAAADNYAEETGNGSLEAFLENNVSFEIVEDSETNLEVLALKAKTAYKELGHIFNSWLEGAWIPDGEEFNTANVINQPRKEWYNASAKFVEAVKAYDEEYKRQNEACEKCGVKLVEGETHVCESKEEE